MFVNLFHNTSLTRLKVDINLNLVKVNKQFGKMNPINVGITLCKKPNIDLKKFNDKKKLLKCIMNLNIYNNILV